MTDKELINDEIERRINNLWHLLPEGERVLQDNFTKDDANNLGKYTELESLLRFIDSLPEEPASEGLEEEMIRWHKEHFGNKRDWGKTSGEYLTRKSQLDLAHHFAEWQKKKDQEIIELAEDHAMLAGMNKMKEEMMENAVYGYVALCHDYPYRRSLVAIADGLINFEYAEKVKIIIVKEE